MTGFPGSGVRWIDKSSTTEHGSVAVEAKQTSPGAVSLPHLCRPLSRLRADRSQSLFNTVMWLNVNAQKFTLLFSFTGKPWEGMPSSPGVEIVWFSL